jgi:hypothetical protein
LLLERSDRKLAEGIGSDKKYHACASRPACFSVRLNTFATATVTVTAQKLTALAQAARLSD